MLNPKSLRSASIQSIFSIIAFLILVCSSVGTQTASAAGHQDLTKYLPADTQVIIHVRDMPGLLQKWDASPFFRFYGDPRTGAFFRPLREQIDSFKQTMNSAQGVDAERLWKFFSGDFVLAGLPAPAGSSDPVEWVMLFEHNSDPLILDRLRHAHDRPGARIQRTTQSCAGFDYTQVSLMREVTSTIPQQHGKKGKKHKKLKLGDLGAELTIDGSDREGTSQLATAIPVKQQITENYYDYFGSGVMIHAGSHAKPLRQILELMGRNGHGPALSAQGDYAKLRGPQKGAGDIAAYANVAGLAGWMAAQGGSPLINVNALRLEEVRAAALTLDLRADRLAVDLAVLAPPPRQGLSRLLFLSAGRPPELARLVPPDAVIYSATQLPLKELWQVLMQTMQGVNPIFQALLEGQFKDLETRTGINVQRDIIGRLGSGVGRFLLPDGEVRNPRELATYIISVNEAEKLRASLLGLLNFVSQTFGTYTIETDKAGPWPLWILNEGRSGVAGPLAGHAIFNVCVTDHYLLLGAQRTGIDAVVERLKNPRRPSLAGQKPFTAMLRQLPEERSGEMYVDTGGVRKMFEAGLLKDLVQPKKGKRAEWLPVSLVSIPEPRLWSDYFGPMGSATTQSEDVFRLRSFVLYPAAQ